MNKEIKHKNQYVRIVFALSLLSFLPGCADSMDQTRNDISKPVNGMVYIADQMYARGDHEGAMEFYARAIQRRPDDEAARKKLVPLLETYGYTADAAEQYAALVQLEPGNAETRRAYGRLLVKLGRLPEAKQQYEAILVADDGDVRARNGLGVVLDLMGHHAEAQNQYKAVLEKNPDDLAAVNNLGRSYVLAGVYEEAIKLLEPEDEKPSVPPALRQNLAKAYAMAGMDVDAERVLKKNMSAVQAKKTVAGFHAEKSKTPSAPAYAYLGSFTSKEFSETRLAQTREQFSQDTKGLTLETIPQIDEEGGTPIFVARAAGFRNVAAADAFCKKLAKNGAVCSAREN